MTARIAPGGRREIGAVAWLGSRIAGRVTGTEPPAFITTLGRGRRQFWGWLAFAGSLMPFGTLTRRENESVILRVAAVTGCAYESAHHRHLGERAGLSAAQIDEANNDTGGLSPELWSQRELTVLAAADELARTGDLTDATWQRVRGQLSEREAIELVQLTNHYVMLATTLRVLRVEPDAPRRTA